ncbi:hypothetical protein, partial [Agathobaculum sp.]|uniref:hypothetical protein n=1 Tax=Agathobaculum sp. TaxID=2048138 RepID=UPI003AB740BB
MPGQPAAHQPAAGCRYVHGCHSALRGGFPPVNLKFRHKTVAFIIFHQNEQKHGMNFIIFNAIFLVARHGKYGIIYNINNELLCTFGR